MSYRIPTNPPIPQPRPAMQGQFPTQPQAPQGNKFMGWLGDNSEALAMMSAGLLSGQTGPEQFGRGFQGFAQGRGAAKDKAETQKKQNATIEWLKKSGADPELIGLTENGAISAKDAYDYHRKAKTPEPNDFTQRAAAARQYGLDPNSPEGQAFILSGKMGGAEGGTKYGMSPVYLQNADGSVGVGQLTSQGELNPSQLPDGYQVLSPYEKSRQTSQGGAVGKGLGEAEVSYRSVESKMPGLETVVQRLEVLADKATYTYAGQALDAGMRQTGMEPREAAIARTEYSAMVDNQVLPMLRDTFGAAFTVKEGETLRSTLGDLNKSPVERKAILRAFIEQKRRDVSALAQQSGQTAPQAQPNQGRTQSGITFTVEP